MRAQQFAPLESRRQRAPPERFRWRFRMQPGLGLGHQLAKAARERNIALIAYDLADQP